MKSLATILILFCCSSIFAQVKPDESWLDFWVGKWKLEWKDKNGEIGKGTNEIKKILDDKIIQEKFEAKSGALKGFKGKSLSVLDKNTGKWKQTWVDNKNNYLDFEGIQKDGNKIFRREFEAKNGKIIIQRMVFSNIKKNSFTWIWEISENGGKSFENKWEIKYQRKIKKSKKNKTK